MAGLVGLLRRIWTLLLSRFSRGEEERGSYYRGQISCQVPNLSFLYERFLGTREDGFFVEVGAYDGVFVSNSWGLAERGWGGLMIEPIADYAALCVKNHRSHPKIRVRQVAINDGSAKEVMIRKGGTLTSANPEAVAEYQTTSWASSVAFAEPVAVPAMSLVEILEEEKIGADFDLLIVDTEGYEWEILNQFDLRRFRPKMLIVELADTHPDLKATVEKDSRLYEQITSVGYVVVFKDAINTVFVRREIYRNALVANRNSS